MKPEVKVKKQVKELLDKYGAYYFSPVASAMGTAGIPDIIACLNGTFIGVECKAGTNKPTGLQQAQLRRIAAAGGVALVINEDNIDALEHTLKSISDSRSVTWSVEDIEEIDNEYRELNAEDIPEGLHMTHADYAELLDDIVLRHDAEYGISWDTIKCEVSAWYNENRG